MQNVPAHAREPIINRAHSRCMVHAQVKSFTLAAACFPRCFGCFIMALSRLPPGRRVPKRAPRFPNQDGGAFLRRGSNYPNMKELGPKYHTHNGIWNLIPRCLGTWTLKVSHLPSALRESPSSPMISFLLAAAGSLDPGAVGLSQDVCDPSAYCRSLNSCQYVMALYPIQLS